MSNTDKPRLVCPNCLTDEGLYSIEVMQVMYPVTATAEGIDYTGTESDYLDETATPTGDLYCRGCDGEFSSVSDLVEAPQES